MKLRSTTIETASETHSHVEMLFADEPDEMAEDEFVRLRMAVEHGSSTPLGAVQIKALRRVGDAIDARIEELGRLADQASG
jgi:hypothetical protein